MTDGYPSTWQQDVPADPLTAEDRHGVAFTTAHDSVADTLYADTTIYDTTTGATGEPTGEEGQGKADAAKEQAAAVGQGAAQAGQQVAAAARDQAQNVVAEAGSQAKDLLGQARSELTEQAGLQQKRVVETLRALGDELESMGQHSQEPGMATDLVQQASGRAHDAASWLDSREPGSLMSELQTFARQRPGAFLALAAAAGLAAGRLGRGVKDAGGDDTQAAKPAGTSVTRTDVARSNAASIGPGFDDDVARPFASSQDSDDREFPSGSGL